MSAWHVKLGIVPMSTIQIVPGKLDQVRAFAIGETVENRGVVAPLLVEPIGSGRHRTADGRHRFIALHLNGREYTTAILLYDRPTPGSLPLYPDSDAEG